MVNATFHADTRHLEDQIEIIATRAAYEIRHLWQELAEASYPERGHPPGSWPPLKESTIRRKKNILEDPSWMLIRTGRMISSNVFEIIHGTGYVTVTATNTAPYWKFHELGTRHVPQRQQLNPELYEKEFLRALEKHFNV